MQNPVKLYLDMCVYNWPFDDQSDLKIKLETIACQMIFEKIQAGEIDLVWSFMLEFENELNPFTERKSEIRLLSRLARHIIEPQHDIPYISHSWRMIVGITLNQDFVMKLDC